MKLIKGEFKERLDLLFAPSIKAGFPSSADDYLRDSLDFNRAFREDLLQYWKYDEERLITPSSSTISIVQAAGEVLDRIFVQGVQYKRGGVIVMGIAPNSPIQQDLFDVDAEQIQKLSRLDQVVDRLNKCYGSETIVIGTQQYTQPGGKGKADVFSNAMKQDHKSKNPTTRWSDIIVLK